MGPRYRPFACREEFVKVRASMAALLSMVAAVAAGQESIPVSEPMTAPVPVIERISTQGDVVTRTSMFSNRVAVVTIREGDLQVFMRQITVPDDEYIVYLDVLQSAAEQLTDRPITSRVETSMANIELEINIGPKAPRRLEFSPMSTVSLQLSRIIGVMDDLELQVRNASESASRLQSWEPQRGDRVQLMNGAYARVIEVWEGGLLILEHEDTYVRESVPPDMRDQIILLVVEPEP